MTDDRKDRYLYRIPESARRVRDMPESMRPREEMERVGVSNVKEDVLLAIVLRSGVHGTNVIDMARGILAHYGSLTAIASSSVSELASIKGVGRVKAQILMAAIEMGRRLSQESLPKRYRIGSPEDAARLLRESVRTVDKEIFWVLHLDAKNCLKGRPEDITHGVLDASLVHPREVFREAIRSATAAVVVAHNHPSADLTPSAEDVRITKQLIEAGRILDISVLDHVIVGRPCAERPGGFLSMREEGLVNFGS